MLQLRSPSDQVKQIAFASTGATTAKTPHVFNSRVWIPLNAALAAASNEFVRGSEISDAPKATGETWSMGDVLYWDDTAKKFTKTSTSNTKCGYALSIQASGDTTGWVDFNSFA